MLTRAECARWLLERDNYLILTHRRPDGDTIGSAAALCLGLRQLGKTARILKNREITAKFAPLHHGLTVDDAEQGDTLISVDVAAPNMLPDQFRRLESSIALRIDHHGTATSFTPNELVDGSAAACAEIVFDVLELMGARLDKSIAEALYVGVSTDTGCFRYANTTAHSYRTAAACMDAGGDVHTITREIFETNSFAKLSMQGWITANTRFYKDGQIAVCALPVSVERQIGVTEDDMDSISGFVRSIEGVKLAATLRQTNDGKVKVSVRAVPGFDAAVICAKFGGGGHKGAAGATVELPLEEAAKAIAEAMMDIYQ